jgi:hypothetical protein
MIELARAPVQPKMPAHAAKAAKQWISAQDLAIVTGSRCLTQAEL